MPFQCEVLIHTHRNSTMKTNPAPPTRIWSRHFETAHKKFNRPLAVEKNRPSSTYTRTNLLPTLHPSSLSSLWNDASALVFGILFRLLHFNFLNWLQFALGLLGRLLRNWVWILSTATLGGTKGGVIFTAKGYGSPLIWHTWVKKRLIFVKFRLFLARFE
jgi:hypothetical protein